MKEFGENPKLSRNCNSSDKSDTSNVLINLRDKGFMFCLSFLRDCNGV